MGKAANFKFCTHIHSDRNESPLKISALVAVGVLRGSRNFSGHPYIGRNVVGQINDVTLRQARLVLGWVTVYGRVNHLGM